MDTTLFKTQLESEGAQLERDMARLGHPNLRVPGEWEPVPTDARAEPDIVDQADVTVSSEENAALLSELNARLRQVREALERLVKGTYGVCATCGAPIEEERLAADPAAPTCKAHL